MYRWTILLLALVMVTSCLLLGCGGGGGGDDPVDLSGTGNLTTADLLWNDYYYDLQEFTATRDGQVEITMSSTAVDAYLEVYLGSGIGGVLVYIDDDSGGGTNARITFPGEQGDTYTVGFSTSLKGETGAYQWTIREL